MRLTKVISVALTFVGLLTINVAMADVPTVEAQLERDSVGIGDRFIYSIIVERDLMQVVHFPEFTNDPSSPVEVIASLPIDTLASDGRRLKLRKRFELTSFEEGQLNMGVARVLYVDKNIVDTLYTTDSLYIDIATFVIDSTSHTIFDLKAQRKMPLKFVEVKNYLLWGFIAVLILALAIYILMRELAKRGKKLGDIFKPIPPLPPHIEAIKALENLHNQKLWQNAKYKEYYSSLTNIVRHYIVRRYEVAAMEMTTDEIIEAMSQIEDLPTKSRIDLTSMLRDADLVKFAKAVPDAEENESSYLKSYYFVEETKIQEEVDPDVAEASLYDVKSGGDAE